MSEPVIARLDTPAKSYRLPVFLPDTRGDAFYGTSPVVVLCSSIVAIRSAAGLVSHHRVTTESGRLLNVYNASTAELVPEASIEEDLPADRSPFLTGTGAKRKTTAKAVPAASSEMRVDIEIPGTNSYGGFRCQWNGQDLTQILRIKSIEIAPLTAERRTAQVILRLCGADLHLNGTLAQIPLDDLRALVEAHGFRLLEGKG